MPDSTSRTSYAWGFGLIVLMVALTTLSFSRFPPKSLFTLPCHGRGEIGTQTDALFAARDYVFVFDVEYFDCSLS